MYLKAFQILEGNVKAQLDALDPRLTYHTIEHTYDVVSCVERIATSENIIDQKIIYLLKVAALYHDTGFLYTYIGHEKKSCSIFLSAPAIAYIDEADRKLVTELIMATRVPQEPKTLLQQIICDADLDYLGRPGFSIISHKLKTELLNYGFITTDDEWDQLQLNFMRMHSYHTHTSKILREPAKQNNYKQLLLY
jgi:hypothetical protein